MGNNVARMAMTGAVEDREPPDGVKKAPPSRVFIAEPAARHDDRALGPAGGLLLGLVLGLALWAAIGFGAWQFFR